MIRKEKTHDTFWCKAGICSTHFLFNINTLHGNLTLTLAVYKMLSLQLSLHLVNERVFYFLSGAFFSSQSCINWKLKTHISMLQKIKCLEMSLSWQM